MTDYCLNHPEKEISNYCQWCGRGCCDLCLADYDSLVSLLCPDCEAMLKIITMGE